MPLTLRPMAFPFPSDIKCWRIAFALFAKLKRTKCRECGISKALERSVAAAVAAAAAAAPVNHINPHVLCAHLELEHKDARQREDREKNTLNKRKKKLLNKQTVTNAIKINYISRARCAALFFDIRLTQSSSHRAAAATISEI